MSYNRNAYSYKGRRHFDEYPRPARAYGALFSSRENTEPERPRNGHSSPPEQKAPKGTNVSTGINAADDQYPKMSHHADKQETVPFLLVPDPKRNYKVLYDPELDEKLLKPERKAKHKKIRFNGESLHLAVADPRKSRLPFYFHKPDKRLKKYPFKQLPTPKFIYDKNSLGLPPLTHLLVWDLPATTSALYLANYFGSYGDPIKDVKLMNDPHNGVPLGIATFTFPGSADKAMRAAKRLLKSLKSAGSLKIDGVDLHIALNDHKNHLLDQKVNGAVEKLRIQRKKRDDEENKKRLALEQKRKEELKKEEERKQEEKRKEEEENRRREEEQKKLDRFRPNTTMLSARHNNKIISGVLLPADLQKYIKDRLYILIHDKYVPTRDVSSQDIKKVLNKYDWTRVLSDITGFYVVFNSLKECERCFFNEDGRHFFKYLMHMELCVPENFGEDNTSDGHGKSHDVVDEGVNLLIKEFQIFLSKDIRERVIAPVVLDLLSHEHYPDLVRELKAKEAAKPAPSAIQKAAEIKRNNITLLAKQQLILPSFKKKFESPKRRKQLIPMQHALNYDHESDDDSDEEDTSRLVTPSTKRERSSPPSDFVDKDEPKKKKTKLRKLFMYEDEDEEEQEEEQEEEPKEEEMEDIVPEQPQAGTVSSVEVQYQPTTEAPMPVYEEFVQAPDAPFDLVQLASVLRDQEDLELAKKVLSGPSATIKNIEYWAWKQREKNHAIVSEEADEVLPLLPRFECKSGSFRSEGYRKIPDADKIEYLPHRRKAAHKPLKTILHEEEETGNNGSNHTGSGVQSSRVNRANNRRFAADISAQKQMLGSETDILNLNALTKRKKPVSFARSAIHNWGLYALEPIAAKEMIIEYVGESIRQQVAEHREKGYLKTGIGSSYLFRIDENTVVDATKKGGIARFINHSCDPSCTAKIIKVEGKKRIVIYALRDIDANDELTYDYKFERESNDDERIRCLCGAKSCKGFLN